MNIITGGRCTGKTYELIKRAAEKHGVIIAANREMQDVFDKFYIPEMVAEGIIPENHGITVSTLSTILKYDGGYFYVNHMPRKAYVDELDLALSCLLWNKGLDLDAVVIGEKPSNHWIKLTEKRIPGYRETEEL